MADVEISVQAEGVEDAVGEVPEGETPEVSGADDDGGGGGGGLGGGGSLGKLLGILAAILTFAEDIGTVINVVSSILRAFLAPVAILLLRLLQPALRLMLNILPLWLDAMEKVNGVVEKIAPYLSPLPTLLNMLLEGALSEPIGAFKSAVMSGARSALSGVRTLLGDAKTAIVNLASTLWSKVQGLASMIGEYIPSPASLASSIWSKMKQLADMIAQKIGEVLPFGGGGDGLFGGALQRDDGGGNDSGGFVERAGNVAVNISGGLGAFVDRIERSSGVEN